MKGIIVEVNEKSAVILNDKGEFRKIKNRNFTIGEKITYRSKKNMYYAACSFVLAISLLSSSAYGFFVPVSYVDMDINPSVRMNVNCFERVIGYEALNNDGEKVISNLKTGKVPECIKGIIAASEDMGYINGESCNVNINVVTSRKKLLEEVEETAIEIDNNGIQVEVYEKKKDIFDKANELGISVGKYSAIEEYTEAFGGDLQENAEMLKEESIGEIRTEINSVLRNTEKREEKAEEREVRQETREADREDKTEEREEKQEARKEAKAERQKEHNKNKRENRDKEKNIKNEK